MLSKARYLEVHSRFYDVFRGTPIEDSGYLDYAKYRNAELSELSLEWMPEEQIRQDCANEILNATNQFCTTNARVEAWVHVLEQATGTQDLLDVLYECVIPIVRMACDFPHAIKSKLIFSVAVQIRETAKNLHLEVEDFADRAIGRKTLRPLKAIARQERWNYFASFCKDIDLVDGQEFKNQTDDYRNSVHHRVAPFLEVGERFVTNRWQDATAKGFTFGVQSPTKISSILPSLREQHSLCMSAFESYWSLSMEIRKSWEAGEE